MTRLHTRIAFVLALAAGIAFVMSLHRQRRAGAKRAALPVRSRLAEAAAEQVEDRRHHRTRRRQGRQRVGAQPPERPARPRAAGRDRHRRLLRAAAVDDPHRQERHVIGSFDPPQGHGMDVDSQGFVYIGSDTVRKYDPKSGKMLMAITRAEPQPGGGGGGDAAPAQRQPGRGSAGPGRHVPATGWRRPRARQCGPGGPGRAGGSARRVAREVSADGADDCRTGRGDSPRRAGGRGLRRRQLVRWTRDGVRPENVCLQARMGRLRPPAQ